MVRLAEKSPKEIDLEQRCHLLANLAQGVCSSGQNYHISSFFNYNFFIHHRQGKKSAIAMTVYPAIHKVTVHSPPYKALALELAEMYQASTGQEFTLHCRY